jgi:hypothetical protein
MMGYNVDYYKAYERNNEEFKPSCFTVSLKLPETVGDVVHNFL